MNSPAHYFPALLRVVDWICWGLTGILAFVEISYYKTEILDFQRYFSLVILTAFFYLIFSKQTYLSWRSTSLLELFGKIIASWATTVILLIVWLVASKTTELYSRIWISLWIVQALFLLIFIRIVAYKILRKLRASGINLRHIAIVGSGETAKELISRVDESGWAGYRVSCHILVPDVHNIKKLANKPLDEIWLAPEEDSSLTLHELVNCLDHSTAIVRIAPDLISLRLINHGFSEVLGVQMIDIHGRPMSDFGGLLKIIFDYSISLTLLICLFPIMSLIGIGVKLNSTGPIFYRQNRVGWNGAIFQILKFRSMPDDIESNGIKWGESDNKTVDKFSKFLRLTNLDELPQLINVIKGEMSLVGPRPERPEFVEVFKDKIPHYMKKHLVKAGITGWAQIHGWRGDTSLQKRLDYDLYYVENWSIFLDIKILLATMFLGLNNKKLD